MLSAAFLMPAMRFVQFADVHLDSSISGALNLPDTKRTSLRQDIRTALTRACSLAREHHVDLVLIPGDLFDYETILPDTTAFLAAAFAEIAPIRVFITPGNHDSLRPNSPYLADWPDNVHIFKSGCFESAVLPDLDCSITGIAHAHRGITNRLLSAPISRPDCSTNILLFHGSRDGYPTEQERVIPFSDQELINQEFTYAAVGHYHSPVIIQDSQGRTRGAYSGCLQGRGLDETGEKYAFLGEIDPEGRVRLEKVEVAPRRIVGISVDLTGSADNQGIITRIDSAIVSAGVRDCDIAAVSLHGTLPAGLVPDTIPLEASDRCFHVAVTKSDILPDYDFEALARDSAASSLRSAYVRAMLGRMESASDEEQRRLLREATYYGLQALDGRALEPRDAD